MNEFNEGCKVALLWAKQWWASRPTICSDLDVDQFKEQLEERLKALDPGNYPVGQARTLKGVKETEFMGFKIVCSCDSGPSSDCLIHAAPKTVIG